MESLNVLALVGAMVAVLVAMGGYIATYFTSAKHLMARVDQLTTRVFALQDEQMDCRHRESDLRAELGLANQRLRALEMRAGVTTPAQRPPGIVVADLSGVVREFSPSLTPLLNYLPREVVGQSFEMLIPPDLIAAAREGFRRAVINPDALAEGREVYSYALAKGGERVAVAMTYHVWRIGSEGLITATIRQRAQPSAPQSAPQSGSAAAESE